MQLSGDVIFLTADARVIVNKLSSMKDQLKLLQIINLLRERLESGQCRWIKDDGGRKASGFARSPGRKDTVGDCVTRAIGIATRKPYREVHDALTVGTVPHIYAGGDKDCPHYSKWAKLRGGVRAFDPDHGCGVGAYGPYLESIGWTYTPTRDQKVRLRTNELPAGRLIVQIRQHLVAVIDGVIHDTYDCGRAGRVRVKGYWTRP